MSSAEPATEAGAPTGTKSTSAKPTDAAPEWGSRLFPQRPSRLDGLTVEKPTPVGDAFITVNTVDSEPVEVFVVVGRAGTDLRALTETIGRLCSVALQHGTPVAELITQLRGISSDNSFGFGDRRVLSVPDAVAQVLERYL